MLLVAEEAESAVREVHHRANDNQRHDPVAKVIENCKARADKQLDEVVAGPGNNIANAKTSG